MDKNEGKNVGKNGKYLVLDLDQTCIKCFDDFAEKPINREEFESYDKMTQKELSKRMRNFTIVDFYPFEDLNGKRNINIGNGSKINITIMKRQYLDEFLDYCLNNFENLIIWSAGKYKYVHLIRDYILPYNSELLVFTYEDLINSKNEFSDEKDLNKVFQQIPKANYNNTLAIDDTNETFLLNPKNGLWIPPFQATNMLKEDNAFKTLISFFETEEFKICKDVRTLDYSNIYDSIPENLRDNYEDFLYLHSDKFTPNTEP